MELNDCPDCRAKPGTVHSNHCDVERCSNCGLQRLSCGCSLKDHSKAFSRWNGFWPGELEAKELGIDLNELQKQGYYKIFFIKPKPKGLFYATQKR